MSDLKEITANIIQFRDERDWAQFHNAKDLSLAISIEASELLELFLWKSSEKVKKEKIREELADVLIFSLLLAEKYGFDVPEMISEKVEKNRQKYPAEKARGTAKKYDEL